MIPSPPTHKHSHGALPVLPTDALELNQTFIAATGIPVGQINSSRVFNAVSLIYISSPAQLHQI